MKKLMVGLLGLVFAFAMAAYAQQDSTGQYPSQSGQTSADQSAAKAPLKTLKGTVQTQGDKVMFVEDNGKSWNVMNPEELKAHEGHHVQVSAHVYADKEEIHVMHVKMMKGESKSGEPMSK
ncbi:MAG TPA: hypothetical protein VFO39_07255 [Candidatus Sulfotelmatobacter sp.]|nr:hypothetical protein [Candidatus Sulfotelmatobacter sp.]